MGQTENKKIISELISKKKNLFDNDFYYTKNYKINKSINIQSLISEKAYQKIFFCLTIPASILAVLPLFLMPLLRDIFPNQIYLFKENSLSHFEYFKNLMILFTYVSFWVASIFLIILPVTFKLIDFMCKIWISKSSNSITIKNIIFNQFNVDNDILEKIKELYGESALYYLIFEYGENKIQYSHIIEFINNSDNINLEKYKKMEHLFANKYNIQQK